MSLSKIMMQIPTYKKKVAKKLAEYGYCEFVTEDGEQLFRFAGDPSATGDRVHTMAFDAIDACIDCEFNNALLRTAGWTIVNGKDDNGREKAMAQKFDPASNAFVVCDFYEVVKMETQTILKKPMH